MYHSSEQLIQYMKAIYFDDEDTASAILKSDMPLDCKQLSKNIKNFNREEWMKAAGAMCEGGILAKFQQNKELSKLLLNTGMLKLAEASKDTDWDIGLSLHDERSLYIKSWYDQGLLGKILEEVRRQLQMSDMETDEDTNNQYDEEEEEGEIRDPTKLL